MHCPGSERKGVPRDMGNGARASKRQVSISSCRVAPLEDIGNRATMWARKQGRGQEKLKKSFLERWGELTWQGPGRLGLISFMVELICPVPIRLLG